MGREGGSEGILDYMNVKLTQWWSRRNAMTPNGIRRLWAEGKPVINGWLSIASPFVAEIMAAQGMTRSR